MRKTTSFQFTKFAVIGGGPVGCILAAFLAKGGHEVTLCDIVPSFIKPAVEEGITVEGTNIVKQKITQICFRVEELVKVNPDVLFITSKANAIPLIASAIESFFKPNMYVVSWQNGIDTDLEIASVLGKKNSLRAIVNYGCELISPCRPKMTFNNAPHFIEEVDKESKKVALAIANILSKCALETKRAENIVSMVWKKAILNASMNPLCAITGLNMAQALSDPIIFQIVNSLLKECIAIARANEISVGWDFYPRAVEYLKMAGSHKPSMLVDIESGRKTEIDFINGKFIEYGERVNIATPFNITLRALIKGLESKLK